MSKSRGAVAPMPVTHSGHLETGQRSSTWRPALRRIKRDLFSSKEIEQERSFQPAGTFPPAEHNAASASGSPQDLTSSLTRRGSRLQKRYTEINAPPQHREKPKVPREPHDLKGFNLMKRTLSRSKKSVPPSTHETTNDGITPLECPVAESIENSTKPSQAQQRAPRKNEIVEAPRPRTAGSVLQHARMNSAQSTQQFQPLQPPANLSRLTKSYAPKHAASDFASMNMMPAVDPTKLNKFSHAHIQFEQPAMIVLSPNIPSVDSTDYQKFLEESRKSASGPVRAPMEKDRRSEVSKVMDEITARHHTNMRERATSISQMSAKSRPVRPPSFVEKLGEYIKPTRPGSVYSQRSFFEGDDKSSLRGSVATGQERWERRWERVGDSLRRSFSRDRDREGDERAGRHWALESENTGKRSRIMPISPGIRKYNQAIAGY